MSRKMTYALDLENNMVYIDDVENGKKCNCFCPACQAPLIARNMGEIRKHHFSHYPEEDCFRGYESSVHILAKNIIQVAEFMVLPGIKLSHLSGFKDIEEKIISIDSVKVEKSHENIKPDLTLTKKDGSILFVEIKFTHGIDSYKEAKIFDLGIDTIEIDLSDFEDDVSKEALTEILLNKSNYKTWILNSIYYQYTKKILKIAEKMPKFYSNDWRRYSYVEICPLKLNKNGFDFRVDVFSRCLRCEYHFVPHGVIDLEKNIWCLGRIKNLNIEFNKTFIDSIREITEYQNNKTTLFFNDDRIIGLPFSFPFKTKEGKAIMDIWHDQGKPKHICVRNQIDGNLAKVNSQALYNYSKYWWKVYGDLYDSDSNPILNGQILNDDLEIWEFISKNYN